MKKFFSILVFFLAAQLAISQSQRHEASEVERVVESLRRAMVDADTAVLHKILSDKLSYGHSNGRVEDKRSFIASLASGQSDFVSIKLNEQNIIVDNSTAVVRHLLEAETNDNGVKGKVSIRVLLIWNKVGTEWKLLARQAVRIS